MPRLDANPVLAVPLGDLAAVPLGEDAPPAAVFEGTLSLDETPPYLLLVIYGVEATGFPVVILSFTLSLSLFPTAVLILVGALIPFSFYKVST